MNSCEGSVQAIQSVRSIQSIRSIRCILKTYLLQNELIRQRKHKRGGSLKIEVLIANTIIKSSVCRKHYIFSWFVIRSSIACEHAQLQSTLYIQLHPRGCKQHMSMLATFVVVYLFHSEAVAFRELLQEPHENFQFNSYVHVN